MTDQTVTVILPLRAAEALAYELSDWACWTAGFRHGKAVGQEFDDGVFIPEWDEARAFNARLKDAIRRTASSDERAEATQ